MDQLMSLFNKKTRLVIGLMSGTSVDGIDAALVEIEGSGIFTKLRQLDFITLPFPAGFKEFVLRNSTKGSGEVADIARLNFAIPYFYADAVTQLCTHAGVSLGNVDLIGSHGQTIHHLPDPVDFFGKTIAATLQIGDPSVIAKLTGVVTVGDFRVGDVALGGQGAPLVPYFDYIMFRSESNTRALLNIGGIANITYIPANCGPDDVVAFDTGPGNMIVDQMMRKYYDLDYDNDGQIAQSGKISDDIMDHLLHDEFVTMKPPKSTGRERYGKEFVSNLTNRYPNVDPRDIIATVTEFTCKAVHSNYVRFLNGKGQIGELFVSGGGVHNKYMMQSLRRHFREANVDKAESIGISSDSKEAVCFAVLANETISGNKTNLPLVTGAARSTILGKICLP